MSKRVLKWIIPVDVQPHHIGTGAVVLVATQHAVVDQVVIWTEETGTAATRTVRVYGTGHEIPEASRHLGSTIAGPYVWHVYEETP